VPFFWSRGRLLRIRASDRGALNPYPSSVLVQASSGGQAHNCFNSRSGYGDGPPASVERNIHDLACWKVFRSSIYFPSSFRTIQTRSTSSMATLPVGSICCAPRLRPQDSQVNPLSLSLSLSLFSLALSLSALLSCAFKLETLKRVDNGTNRSVPCCRSCVERGTLPPPFYPIHPQKTTLEDAREAITQKARTPRSRRSWYTTADDAPPIREGVCTERGG